jgi:hypothetical protein
MPAHRVPLEKRQYIASLYEMGCSVRDIRRQLKVDADTVKKAVIEAGMKMRPIGGGYPAHFRLPHAEVDRTIFLYHKLEFSLEETAQILGLHPSSVGDRLRRAGAPPRPRPESVRIRHRGAAHIRSGLTGLIPSSNGQTKISKTKE